MRFDNVRYSVPAFHAGARVAIEALGGTIRIRTGNLILAEHPRCFIPGSRVEDPLHVKERRDLSILPGRCSRIPFMTNDQIADRNVFIELNRNESQVLAERMRAWLTFYGFLFAAVGVSASQRLFILAMLLALVGAVLSIPWIRSVLLSYRGMAAISATYDKCKPVGAPGLDAYRVTRGEFMLLPEVSIPVAIGITWILVLAVLGYYFFYPSALSPKP